MLNSCRVPLTLYTSWGSGAWANPQVGYYNCYCWYSRVNPAIAGSQTFLLLAGGVPPCAVSPLVVFPPAVFGGCAPSGLSTTLSL